MYSSVFAGGVPMYNEYGNTLPKKKMKTYIIEVPEPLGDDEVEEQNDKRKEALESEYGNLEHSDDPAHIKSVKQANILIKREVHNGLEIKNSTQGTSLYIDGNLFKPKEHNLSKDQLAIVHKHLEKIYNEAPEGAAKEVIGSKVKKLENMLKPKETSSKPRAGRPLGSKNKKGKIYLPPAE